MQVGKRGAEQTHLGGGMSEIDRARAMRRVGSGQHKIARYGEGMLVGAFDINDPVSVMSAV